MIQKAKVTWIGSLKDGSGIISSESGALQNVPYSFSTRFENKKGTNPEELVAAAHAACFSMAFSGDCAQKGFTVNKIITTAMVSIKKVNDQWTVTSSNLEMEADVLNINEDVFQQIATETKINCPISRLLKADITLQARLIHGHGVLHAT